MRTFTFISAVAAMFVSAAVAGAQDEEFASKAIFTEILEKSMTGSMTKMAKSIFQKILKIK